MDINRAHHLLKLLRDRQEAARDLNQQATINWSSPSEAKSQPVPGVNSASRVLGEMTAEMGEGVK